ncbi:MAG: peptidyl-tRNA hydrolase [Lachnospiraceae bacterium]|nr:peptidyl-tRNA hydrolase [Lachnospiraceae bacterium]
MYKQLIIARKDLNMGPGKLSAQVAHASMAFLMDKIKRNAFSISNLVLRAAPEREGVNVNLAFDAATYEEWFLGDYTKVVCGARDKKRLLKAIERAEELGMQENVDFWVIKDKCYTDLEPEEEDGTTITCIGFRPMDGDTIEKISKKYQLYGG